MNRIYVKIVLETYRDYKLKDYIIELIFRGNLMSWFKKKKKLRYK